MVGGKAVGVAEEAGGWWGKGVRRRSVGRSGECVGVCVCVCVGGGGFLGNGITTLSGHSGIEFAKVRNKPVVNNTEPFPLARR